MITIQRLNMDNSWFIDFDGVRCLIDPWLMGSEIDFFPWFNSQWHRTPPIVFSQVPNYDFVLITQKYPDHFHKETLSKLKPDKLVIPRSITNPIKKLLPEAQAIPFNNGLQKPFGLNLKIHFLATNRKIDPIYDALIIENGERSIFLASHGFSPDDKQKEIIRSSPPFELLITPFNLYRLPVLLGGIVSPGIESVKQLVEIVQPIKVVATHDEDKFAKGLVSRFAKITRAPGPEKLNHIGFLKGKYLHIHDYQQHSI